MPAIVILLVIFIPVLIVGGLFAFLQSQRMLRESKNYERGLKMVPLLIHLPPVSDDIEASSRDSRDVVDENISKAQVLYNVIASTSKKDFKSNIFGQRHIAFEVVAVHGFVYFYAAVPVALVSVVTQAIVSAYPSARIEEVAEHNLFNEAGRLSGTIGGELVLKESFAYPIATYQEVKRDTMQSLLSALSTLEKEDGAGVQILLRPAHKNWTKISMAEAEKKKKGERKVTGSSNVWYWFTQVFYALAKPPEEKESDKKVEITGVDQTLVDAIEAKTQHPGYEVVIRLVVSSNVSQRAQAIYSNLVASFSLFDSAGRNGFKHVPARSMQNFVTAYIMRFFPQERNKLILNTIELSSIFHFPDQSSIPTTQLERQTSKQIDGPRNMPEEGLILGYNVFRGAKKKVILSNEDRMRHVYVVGQTGVGKSVFLENIALQDMLSGQGFAFVDPHGDTAEKLLSMVPKERTEDVIYFCPADMEYPMGLNLFEFDDPDQQDFLIQEGINMLYKLYDPQRQGIIGPRYEYMFRNAAKAIMAGPEGGSFIDIPKLFNDKAYLGEKLKHVNDKVVLDFWQKEVPQSERSNEFGEVKSWFVSKFSAFLGNDMMRNIIGQTKSSFNMREIMDNKKILLVNLSKGRTGELNAKLLGMLFVMKFQMAAMSRSNIPEQERVPFTLYVDEFQNFATESFAQILSEARKFRLSLIVANQFTTQLTDEVRDAIFGNVGSVVSFRVSAQDAEQLVRQFFNPIFDIDDLTRLPVGNVATRMLINGFPTQPFSMTTLPPLGHTNQQLKEALQQLSSSKFGRERALVEKEIKERLETPEMPPNSRFNRGPTANQSITPPGPGAPTSTTTPSNSQTPSTSPGNFLDEWLKKRSAGSSAPTAGSATTSAQSTSASSQLPRPRDVESPPWHQPVASPSASQPVPERPSAPELESSSKPPISTTAPKSTTETVTSNTSTDQPFQPPTTPRDINSPPITGTAPPSIDTSIIDAKQPQTVSKAEASLEKQSTTNSKAKPAAPAGQAQPQAKAESPKELTKEELKAKQPSEGHLSHDDTIHL